MVASWFFLTFGLRKQRNVVLNVRVDVNIMDAVPIISTFFN